MFIGMDVHVGHFTFAIIDMKGKLIDVFDSDDYRIIEDYLVSDICWLGIDGPDGLNHGLMDDEDYRKTLAKNLKGHYNKKVSEYLLTIRGIRPFSTPSSFEALGAWKHWMMGSFEIFNYLRTRQFQSIHADNIRDIKHGMVEVFPHGSFTVLLDHLPLKKSSEEGLTERMKVLETYLGDLSEFVKGSKKRRSDLLDAIVAALTVYRLYHGKGSLLGDIVEGQVALPGIDISDKYVKGM